MLTLRREQSNRSASSRAASATDTPDSSCSAAALTRRAYSLASTRPRPPAMTQHVLLNMSGLVGDTPRPFQPAITQRDIEVEVAHCVGGVLSPLLANVALHVLDEHLHRPWQAGGA